MWMVRDNFGREVIERFGLSFYPPLFLTGYQGAIVCVLLPLQLHKKKYRRKFW
jgi:hypothetical protein